jgi:hypothetical protein
MISLGAANCPQRILKLTEKETMRGSVISGREILSRRGKIFSSGKRLSRLERLMLFWR